MSNNIYKSLIDLYRKTDKTNEQILDDIRKEEEKIRNANPNWSDKDVFEHLQNAIYNKQKRILSDVGTEDWIIEIHNLGRPIDWTAVHHARCESEKKKDPRKADDEGYIKVQNWNPDGTPDKYIHLDYRDKKADGTENRMKGRKLQDSAYIRRLGGIALRLSAVEVGFKKFEMLLGNTLADPNHEDFRSYIPINTRLNIKAKLTKEDSGRYILEGTVSTFFNDRNEQYAETTPELIESLYKDDMVNLMNIEDVFEKNIDKKLTHKLNSYKLCVAKCQVVAMEPASGTRSAIIYVDTIPVWKDNGELDTTKCRGMYDDQGNKLPSFHTWWGEGLPWDFGVGTTTFLFFSMGKSEIKDGNEWTGNWTNLQFNASGCFFIKKVEKESQPLEEDGIEVTEDLEVIPDADDLEEFSDEVTVKETSDVVEVEIDSNTLGEDGVEEIDEELFKEEDLEF